MKKPVVRARLPKLLHYSEGLTASFVNADVEQLLTQKEETTGVEKAHPPRSDDEKYHIKDVSSECSGESSPSVCLRAVSVNVEDNPSDDLDTTSWLSFQSESLSTHGFDSYQFSGDHEDLEDDEDENIDPSSVNLVHFPGDADDMGTFQEKPTLPQNVSLENKTTFIATNEEAEPKPSLRPRSEELKELKEFARWAERFGGGVKGLSMASVIQDCRQTRQGRQHSTGNGVDLPVGFSMTRLDDLTSLLSEISLHTDHFRWGCCQIFMTAISHCQKLILRGSSKNWKSWQRTDSNFQQLLTLLACP